jgi:hypothetical protein
MSGHVQPERAIFYRARSVSPPAWPGRTAATIYQEFSLVPSLTVPRTLRHINQGHDRWRCATQQVIGRLAGDRSDAVKRPSVAEQHGRDAKATDRSTC